jgi:hypothetical protein
MTFVAGIYFMIVTMSTLGYGDIYPGHYAVRLWLMVTLLAYVAIISNDLTKLSDCLKNVSEYETYSDYKNHLVILGSYNDLYLWDFVKNIYEDLKRN